MGKCQQPLVQLQISLATLVAAILFWGYLRVLLFKNSESGFYRFAMEAVHFKDGFLTDGFVITTIIINQCAIDKVDPRLQRLVLCLGCYPTTATQGMNCRYMQYP